MGGEHMPQRSCVTCGQRFAPRTGRTYRCPLHESRGDAARSPSSRQRSNPEYLSERARILAGDPLCHWCRREPATTADHIIPVAHGGGHRANLVPACESCNKSRQANPNWRPR